MEEEKPTTSVGLFWINDQQHLASLKTIANKITTLWGKQATPNWRLDHRLLTSNASSSSKLSHTLQLSHIPNTVFNVTEVPEGNTTTKVYMSIPSRSKDDWLHIVQVNSAGGWTPKANLWVNNGLVFTLHDATIRIGEVKLMGSNTAVRALLVAIELVSGQVVDGSLTKEEETRVKEDIQRLWRDINPGATTKESWGFGSEEEVIKAWCEIMKAR